MAYRFSPSPTGKLHLGSVRTAVVSYILSQQENKKFILRIEDTDKVRSHKKWTTDIITTLSKLNLQISDKIVYQSQQEDTYEEFADALHQEGFAYYCNCSLETLKDMKKRQILTKTRIGYDGTCREKGNSEGVLRLNIKAIAAYLRKKHIHFEDSIFKSKTLDYRDIPDPVLLRANGDATYLMANTLDDYMADVTHIVRGADLLPQTFIQMLLWEAFSVVHSKKPVPKYTHLPLMLDEKGEKISKRKEDTKAILDYLQQGIFPNAIIQFVLSIGNKSIPTDRALTLEEMIKMYDVTLTSPKNTKYLLHKLMHINKLHLKASTSKEIYDIIKTQYGTVLPVDLIELLKVRYRDLQEITQAGSKIVDSYLQFAEDKRYLPTSIEEIKEYRQKVFNGESTPPINEVLPILQQELLTEERIEYGKD